MQKDITAHEHWFASFAESYCEAEKQDRAILELKIRHTAKVLEHARFLVQEGAVPAFYERACLLAALYHDVARFPQFQRWRTFKDSLSTNHGLLGVKTLKRHRPLQGEDKETAVLVMAAVALHNRYAVPKGIPHAVALVTQVVRDADKLDIVRVMAEHFTGQVVGSEAVVLHVADEPDCWTPKVVDDVLAGRLASYADLHYINDFKLLLGTWLHELYFDATRRQLASSGNMQRILSTLPDHEPVRRARQYIENALAALHV